MAVTKKIAAPPQKVARPKSSVVPIPVFEPVATIAPVKPPPVVFKLPYWPVLASLGGVILLIAGSLAFYQVAFAGKIYPGVSVGSISLGGKTQAEAEALLTEAWNEFTKTGVTIKFGDSSTTLTSLVTSPADPDLTYELLRFNPAQAASQAYNLGRQGGWHNDLFEPIVISLTNNLVAKISVQVELDRVLQYMRDSFPELEQIPQPARLVVDLAGNISVQAETSGVIIEAADLESNLKQRLVNLSQEPVELKLKIITPTLNQTLVASLLPQARTLLKDNKLIFAYNDETWEVEPVVWHQWLGVKMSEQNSQAELALLPELANEFFNPIEQSVDQPARDAKFEIRDGRVTLFQGSWQGRQIDRQATIDKAFIYVKEDNFTPVELVVAITESNITTAETNELGISEIIGVGRSNFKGSPANRRHNIKVGADALNGLLIKPGEEFSLLKALLPVDATTGYLPELVIKGNKTIPEYGGGLCQIGTTIFRAALASGLPITARRNHSYRVVYYEPAGTDATIYDPAPDFKFVNDTGNTILIQTRIEGDDLYFEFWGRPDGRKVMQTKPRVFNITAPPPTKIIETEDLEPGVKKCTEKPHSGADTEFTYTVTYDDGETKTEVFKSHYIPWQEVCLLGVPKGTLTPPEIEQPNPDAPPTTEATDPAST